MLLFLPIAALAQPDTLWGRWYGGGQADNGYAVQQTLDGGFVIAGETYSFGAGGYDFYLIRTDSTGDTLWTRTYGGVQDETCFALTLTPDSG